MCQRRRVREAVNVQSLFSRNLLRQDCPDVVVCLARVNRDRLVLPGLQSCSELPSEHLLLHVARAIVVMIIEADLAPTDTRRVCMCLFKGGLQFIIVVFRLVRMCLLMTDDL